MILLALTLSAVAADAAPPKPAARMICRSVQRTGTRLAHNRPVCATADEWKLLAQRARKDTEDIQRRSQPEQLPVF